MLVTSLRKVRKIGAESKSESEKVTPGPKGEIGNGEDRP